MKNWLIGAGAVAGSVMTIIALLTTLGFELPRPAWSSDIERLTRQQAETAADLYDQKVKSLLIIPAPSDPAQRYYWEDELSRAKAKRSEAEKRLIELSR